MAGLILIENKFEGNKASSGGAILLLESNDSIISLMKASSLDFMKNVADYGSALRYIGLKKQVLEIQF